MKNLILVSVLAILFVSSLTSCKENVEGKDVVAVKFHYPDNSVKTVLYSYDTPCGFTQGQTLHINGEDVKVDSVLVTTDNKLDEVVLSHDNYRFTQKIITLGYKKGDKIRRPAGGYFFVESVSYHKE